MCGASAPSQYEASRRKGDLAQEADREIGGAVPVNVATYEREVADDRDALDFEAQFAGAAGEGSLPDEPEGVVHGGAGIGVNFA
jgi:hypothetical protein